MPTTGGGVSHSRVRKQRDDPRDLADIMATITLPCCSLTDACNSSNGLPEAAVLEARCVKHAHCSVSRRIAALSFTSLKARSFARRKVVFLI